MARNAQMPPSRHKRDDDPARIALLAILDEVTGSAPHSPQSYLPAHLVRQAWEALAVPRDAPPVQALVPLGKCYGRTERAWRRGVGEANAFIARIRRERIAPEVAAALIQLRMHSIASDWLGMVAGLAAWIAWRIAEDRRHER